MTEGEWFACTDPNTLAAVIRGQVNPIRFREMALRWIERCEKRRWGDRTFTLRRFQAWLRGEAPHPRTDATAPVIDSSASYGTAEYEANAAVDRLVWDDDPLTTVALAGTATLELQSSISPPFDADAYHTALSRREQTAGRFAVEFRDIAGNPFRPVAWQPEWNSETAALLARGIEIDRAFDRMPILADALEEAGCDSPQVLQHCRHVSVHVLGCWVLDGVLGRPMVADDPASRAARLA
jgi:hypothetical protein